MNQKSTIGGSGWLKRPPGCPVKAAPGLLCAPLLPVSFKLIRALRRLSCIISFHNNAVLDNTFCKNATLDELQSL